MILTFAEVAEVLGTLWSLTEAPPRETLLLPESGEGKSLRCHFNFLASGSWLEAGFCVGSRGGKRLPWLKQNTEFAISCWLGEYLGELMPTTACQDGLESLIERRGGERA